MSPPSQMFLFEADRLVKVGEDLWRRVPGKRLEEWLDVQSVARLMSVSIWTVHRMIGEGELRVRRKSTAGKSPYLVERGSVEEVLESLRG